MVESQSVETSVVMNMQYSGKTYNLSWRVTVYVSYGMYMGLHIMTWLNNLDKEFVPFC